MDWSALFASILSLWHSFPTLPLAGKIAGVLAVVIGLVKSSALQPLWDKLGAAKALVAPVLGLVISVLGIQPLSWQGVWIGLSGGVLALGLTNVLDAVKSSLALGPTWVSIIDMVEKLLAAPAPSPQQQAAKEALKSKWAAKLQKKKAA